MINSNLEDHSNSMGEMPFEYFSLKNEEGFDKGKKEGERHSMLRGQQGRKKAWQHKKTWCVFGTASCLVLGIFGGSSDQRGKFEASIQKAFTNMLRRMVYIM